MATMQRLGYDDVWIDRAGNVIGAMRGNAGGRSVQFNSHIDHVSPGDLTLWPRDPYDPAIVGDILYGRGASDVKGAMAPQVFLVPVLRDLGLVPAGDVFAVGVVLEEVGGFGCSVLCQEMPTDFAVLSEASNNQIRRGHRGRVLMKVSFSGVSSHASAPERARNPHFAMSRFLLMVEELTQPAHPTFGGPSVAPTISKNDQISANVTPGTLSVYLDYRDIPGETAETVVGRFTDLVHRSAAACDGITGSIEVVQRNVRTYTGIDATMPPTRAFEVAADHPLVTTAASTLESTLDRPVEVGTWTFSTDGGHLAHHGITTIGFAPGEERFAHTVDDQVSLSKMAEALVGNVALALSLPTIPKGAA
jgi:succinyl-diaminopimelate desuccinylase